MVCDIHDCETNSLFFKSSLDHLVWKFEHNRCISHPPLRIVNPSLICTNATKIVTETGLTCRRRLEIEECICTNSNLAMLPNTKSSILTLGDCESVLVTETQKTQIRLLYLYRTRMIIVESMPKTLQQLEVLHSIIRFEKPFLISENGIDQLKFNGVVIETLTEQTFAHGFINLLVFNNSVLSFVAENAFSGSSIQQLNVVGSEILSAGDLFKHTKSAKIISSKIKNTTHLSNISRICFQNNTIDCQCTSEDDFKLSKNQCMDETNRCIAENNEIWRKTRNTKKICSSNKNKKLQFSTSSSLYFSLSFFSFGFFLLHV